MPYATYGTYSGSHRGGGGVDEYLAYALDQMRARLTVSQPGLVPTEYWEFGGGATLLDPRITFSRSTPAWYIKNGILRKAEIDEPVFEGGALRLEAQATNYCINSTPTSERPVTAVGVGTTVQYLSDANGPYVQVDYDGSGDGGGFLTRVNITVALEISVLSLYLWDTTNSIRFTSNLIAGGPSFENPTPQMEKLFVKGFPYTNHKNLLFYPNNNNDPVSFKFRGVQLEEGEKPTSLIPTHGSFATRAADNFAFDGAAFREAFNPASGVLVFKVGEGSAESKVTLGPLEFYDMQAGETVTLVWDGGDISVFKDGVLDYTLQEDLSPATSLEFESIRLSFIAMYSPTDA